MGDIDSLVEALDDDPDPLHNDFTPAVHELATRGLDAVPALLGPLSADSADTRLRAQRVLEGIVFRRHGFQSGRGFPDGEADGAAQAELSQIGYDAHAPEPDRAAASERLRAWLDGAR